MKTNLKNKIGTMLCCVLSFCCIQQTKAADIDILIEKDTTWTMTIKNVTLAKREMHKIDFSYMSTKVDGTPVRLSGNITIPLDVWNGDQPCDGMVLYNHYTMTSETGIPTDGTYVGPNIIMSAPIKPNYIVVSSDLYGFGITKGEPQYYCYDTANAQASIDCLLAARELLTELGIDMGKYLFNIGYSSGGYDAMAVQKLRDNKYRDVITFDKTLVGGAPFDANKAYTEIVAIKDSVAVYPISIILLVDTYNRLDSLGLSYSDYLREPVASQIEEWLTSHQYTTTELCEKIGKGLRYTDIFTDAMFDPESELSQRLTEVLAKHYIGKDWNFDPTQNLFVMHLRKDSYVPVQASRSLVNLLRDNGYTANIVPYKTNLQTNMVILNEDHVLVGGSLFMLHALSELFAHPVLYYDDELNPYVASIVDEATLMGIVLRLEQAGVDVRKLIDTLTGKTGDSSGGDSNIFLVLEQLDSKLREQGTSLEEVFEMLDDSGISIIDIILTYQYLYPETVEDDDATRAQTRDIETIQETPDVYYTVPYLLDWMKKQGVDIFNQ